MIECLKAVSGALIPISNISGVDPVPRRSLESHDWYFIVDVGTHQGVHIGHYNSSDKAQADIDYYFFTRTTKETK